MTLSLRDDSEWLWHMAVTTALGSVSSDGTKQMYKSVYNQWQRYCDTLGHPLLNLLPSTAYRQAGVNDFICKVNSSSARHVRLSALKLVMRALCIQVNTPETHQMLAFMGMYKVPMGDSEMHPTILSLAQVYELLETMPTNTIRDVRNRAVIALYVATGARRSEIGLNTFRSLGTGLKWHDFDQDMQIVHLAHKGRKGKKEAVSILLEKSAGILSEWRDGHTYNKWVFPRISGTKNFSVKDAPIGDETVYRIVKDAGQCIGVEIKPHDLRRTFITVALTNGGMPLEEVQKQVGHQSISVTGRYIYSQGAKVRSAQWRERFRK